MQLVQERYLTTREIASTLRVHEATVRRWLESGELRGFKLPGGWRVTEASFEAFLAERRGEASELGEAPRRRGLD